MYLLTAEVVKLLNSTIVLPSNICRIVLYDTKLKEKHLKLAQHTNGVSKYYVCQYQGKFFFSMPYIYIKSKKTLLKCRYISLSHTYDCDNDRH